MPLRDHFPSPWADENLWEGFHSAWVNTIVRHLNGDQLSTDYRAIPHADYRSQRYGVDVVDDRRNMRLVAAVELATPGNKEQPEPFTSNCAARLQSQACIVIVDIVTLSGANLHQELLSRLGQSVDNAYAKLYSGVYRSRPIQEKWQVDVWSSPLAIRASLPTVPLWLAEDVAVPFDLEKSYEETCKVLRIE
jgi:hypothetical protein